MSGYVQSNQTITLPLGNYTVSSADTGKTLLIPAQGAAIIRLPNASLGLHYRFIMLGVATGTINITTGAAGGLRGVALTANSTVPITAAATNVNFVNTAADGDFIDAYCYSATSWSISAGTQINAGITVT